MSTRRLGKGFWILGLLIAMTFPSQSRGQYRGHTVSAGGTAPAMTFSLGLPVSGQSTLFSTRFVDERGVVGSDIEFTEAVPTQYLLRQNYPNPFKTSTTIQFGLPVDAYVTIEICNLLGQVVSTLIVDELRNAGYHEVAWDVSGGAGILLSSGVYMYRMKIYPHSKRKAGALLFTSTQQMVLIR